MKSLFLLILVLLMNACISSEGFVQEKYTFFNHDSEEVNFKIKIPKNYSDKKIIVGGHGREYQYWYPDSSVIYVSSDEYSISLNEENIGSQKGADAERLMAQAESTDLILEGKVDNLYWKEVILKEEIKLGYKGVSKERKALFDKAVESFSLK